MILANRALRVNGRVRYHLPWGGPIAGRGNLPPTVPGGMRRSAFRVVPIRYRIAPVSAPPLGMQLFDQARSVLQRHYGYPDFRGGQKPAIEAVLSGRDALILM